MAALPQGELNVKVAQLLHFQGPGWCLVCRNTDCLPCRNYGPIRVFFWVSCSWRSEGLFGQFCPVALPVQALRGLPCLGSFSVVWCVRHIEGAPLAGVLLCISVYQALKRAPWVGSYSVGQCASHLMGQPIYCSAADADGVGRQRPWWWLHPLRVTQQYCLASMAAWLSSPGFSHHELLSHVPLICLFTVSCSPCPGIAPQSLNSSSQPLHLPGDQRFCQAYLWLQQGLSSSHSI